MAKDALSYNNTSLLKVIQLLSDLVVFNHYEFDEFLKKLIKVVLEVVPVDSCLIYLYDRDNKELILIGSKKPHKKEIGKIVLKTGEGITGWVAEHKRTVSIEKEAYKDTRFKFFKELPEDKYESFLSVPILDGDGVVGVVNLQNRGSFDFSHDQIKTVESLVNIIASAFVNVVLERRVDQLQSKLEERKLVERAKGVLMKSRNITEDEAYRLIRKESMDKRRSMKEIAEAILLVWK